ARSGDSGGHARFAIGTRCGPSPEGSSHRFRRAAIAFCFSGIRRGVLEAPPRARPDRRRQPRDRFFWALFGWTMERMMSDDIKREFVAPLTEGGRHADVIASFVLGRIAFDPVVMGSVVFRAATRARTACPQQDHRSRTE